MVTRVEVWKDEQIASVFREPCLTDIFTLCWGGNTPGRFVHRNTTP